MDTRYIVAIVAIAIAFVVYYPENDVIKSPFIVNAMTEHRFIKFLFDGIYEYHLHKGLFFLVLIYQFAYDKYENGFLSHIFREDKYGVVILYAVISMMSYYRYFCEVNYIFWNIGHFRNKDDEISEKYYWTLERNCYTYVKFFFFTTCARILFINCVFTFHTTANIGSSQQKESDRSDGSRLWHYFYLIILGFFTYLEVYISSATMLGHRSIKEFGELVKMNIRNKTIVELATNNSIPYETAYYAKFPRFYTIFIGVIAVCLWTACFYCDKKAMTSKNANKKKMFKFATALCETILVIMSV